LGVHIGVSDTPVLIADPDTVVYFLLAGDKRLSDAFDVNASNMVLIYFEVSFRPVEQVLYALHVDLNHGYFDSELYLIGGFCDLLEYVAHHAGDDASLVFVGDVRACHRVGLARRGLAIC
jgi:hypothetical protein